MSVNYDKWRIRKFMEHPLLLKSFAATTVTSGKRNRVERVDLDFDHLPPGTPGEKAEYLVKEQDRRTELADLIFYLTNYWLEEFHGPPDVLFKAGLHEDICIAAQEL